MVDVININHFHSQLAPSVQVMTDEHLGEWEGRGGEGRGGGKGETRMNGEDDKRSNTGQTSKREEQKWSRKEGGGKKQ